MITSFRFIFSMLPFLLLSAITTMAQQPVPAVNYNEKYKDDDAVYLEYFTDITIKRNKAGVPEVVTKNHRLKYFYSSRARLYTEENLDQNLYLEVSNLKVDQYYLQESGKYKKAKVAGIETYKPYSSDVFYDDRTAIRIKYAPLRPQSQVALDYTENIKDLHFFGVEHGAAFYPIIHGRVTLHIEPGIEVVYQEHNFHGYNIEFNKTTDQKGDFFSWEFHDIPAIRHQTGMLPVLAITPSISFQVARYANDKGSEVVFSDTNDLFNWYYSKIENVLKDDSDSLKAFSQTLVDDSMTDLEKVKVIYNWIQKNIKYIAIEYGEGGLVPRHPGLVYSRRYGDCKDMACMIYKMTGYVGVKTNLCWIGTRRLPYEFRNVPSPIAANHMICTYSEGDKVYFLDATATSNPITQPPYSIQGKQGMIELGEGQYRIIEVPEVDYSENRSLDSCRLKLEGNDIVGKCKCEFSGYFATEIRQELPYKSEPEQKSFSAMLSKGNNKFELISYDYANLDDIDHPLLVNYEFRIPDFVQRLDDKYYVNLNLSQLLKRSKYDINTYLHASDGPFQFLHQEVNTLEIPENYSAASIPDSWTLDQGDYAFSFDYSKLPGKEITLDHSIKIEHLRFPTDRFTEWNGSIEQLNKQYKNVIVLKQNPDEIK